jgi:VWFA-related protein
VVLVIDDALIPHDPRITADAKAAARIIVQLLKPADLMAVVFTAGGRNAQDFTKDREKLLEAIERFQPGFASYQFGYDLGNPPGPNTDAHYYAGSVRTLSSTAEYLSTVPQVRKLIFWISPGVPLDFALAAPAPAGSTSSVADRELMANLIRQAEDVYRKALSSNIAIYPIDPTGLGGLESFLNARSKLPANLIPRTTSMAADFLQSTAANTGGRAIVNTADYGHPIGRIFNENSAYYVLAIRRETTRGGFRRLEVTVNHPGASVRTRSGYEVADPRRPTPTPSMSPEAIALGEAIGGILPNPDLPLRVVTAAFAVPGQARGAVTIALGVDQPLPSAVADRSIETTELQISAFTPDGEPRGTQRHRAQASVRAGAAGSVQYDVLGRIDLAPGRYRLRIAAHNRRSATSGSVFTDVEVSDYNRMALSASGVVLAATPGPVTAGREVVASFLPVIPTSARTFEVSDRIAAFLRIYEGGRQPAVPAVVTMTLVDRYGSTLVTETRAVDPKQFVSTPSLRTADVSLAVPVRGLTAGEYLLRIDVTAGSETLRRDLRFSIH